MRTDAWRVSPLIYLALVLALVATWRVTCVIPAAAQAKTKVNPQDGLTYVFVPPGTFQMGCSPGDSECGDEEKPPHAVTITNGFWIGQTPVTQEAFKKVVGTNPTDFDIDVSAPLGAKSRFPIEGTSWDDAEAYCEAVSMRLPTEAEWEYAARGGSAAPTYGPLDQIAWYSADSGGAAHEVGQKRANGFGLYDMLGNVWEWVADWYGNYSGASASDPKGAAHGQQRVLRGGSWSYDASFVRVSFRLWDDPEGPRRERPSPAFGFRCAGN